MYNKRHPTVRRRLHYSNEKGAHQYRGASIVIYYHRSGRGKKTNYYNTPLPILCKENHIVEEQKKA